MENAIFAVLVMERDRNMVYQCKKLIAHENFGEALSESGAEELVLKKNNEYFLIEGDITVSLLNTSEYINFSKKFL